MAPYGAGEAVQSTVRSSAAISKRKKASPKKTRSSSDFERPVATEPK